MITELPKVIRKLLIIDGVIVQARELVESFRAKKVEGCLLWYGYVLDEDTCLITTCVSPRQNNNRTSYEISAESIREVRRTVRPFGLLLLMQVHTHPKEAYFSEWDEQNALNKRPGALNMIIPDYGNVSWIDADRFCIVEMDDAGEWRTWSEDDWHRIQMIPSGTSVATQRND